MPPHGFVQGLAVERLIPTLYRFMYDENMGGHAVSAVAVVQSSLGQTRCRPLCLAGREKR